MEIGKWKQAKSYMLRPGTPEQAKKAEENNKKYLEERAAKTRKYYGLDQPGPLENKINEVKALTKEEKDYVKTNPYGVTNDAYKNIKTETAPTIAEENLTEKAPNNIAEYHLEKSKSVPQNTEVKKKTKPIAAQKIDPIISDPYSAINPFISMESEPFRNSEELKKMEDRFNAIVEQIKQEKIKNQTTGLAGIYYDKRKHKIR